MDTKQTEATKPPGIYSLMCVISELRDTAMFRDEEGEITNNLRALRDWADRTGMENETLRAGYDAARLEIASLKAQLESVGAGGVGPLMAAPAQTPPAEADVQNLIDSAPEPFRRLGNFLASALDEDLWETAHRLLTSGLVAISAAPQPAAQALDSVRVFWQQHTQADALSMTMAKLHDDVELVIRAARGTAQAAPVDADAAIFEFWWADHMPNATQEEAWAEWCALRGAPHSITAAQSGDQQK